MFICQLVITETTNNIYNKTLLLHVTPFAAFTWQRAMVASMEATSAGDWAAIFQTSNSGSTQAIAAV